MYIKTLRIARWRELVELNSLLIKLKEESRASRCIQVPRGLSVKHRAIPFIFDAVEYPIAPAPFTNTRTLLNKSLYFMQNVKVTAAN